MTRPSMRRRLIPLDVAVAAVVVAGAIVLGMPGHACAQQVTVVTRDSLRLGALHAAALRRDPRRRQLELLAAQAALRERSLDAEGLPSLSVDSRAQYQSDVAAIPFRLPGVAVSPPPHDSHDAYLGVQQRLYDPTRAPRRDVERARLAEAQARVRASLHALRQGVNEAFFAALLAQAQHTELAAGITDLEAQLAVARERVREGAALPSEAAVLEAELLRRGQALAEAAAGRDAALMVLRGFVPHEVTGTADMAIPDLRAAVARARAGYRELRARPEYEQFTRSRELLERQQASVAAQDRPRLAAFGRAGYGRPGLNPLARDFGEYWLAGVQVEWTPWRWGTTAREREELALQQQIVATEEAAFTEAVRRDIMGDLIAADRLERTLATDDAIIALRERILQETRLRLAEGVVTAAEFVDRETDALAARLARATHRVELARAHARVLTVLGLEVP